MLTFKLCIVLMFLILIYFVYYIIKFSSRYNYAIQCNRKGIEYKNQGKYELAINEFQKAINIMPSISIVHYDLGLIFLKVKQYKKAKMFFEKAIKIEPKFTSAYYFLALLNYEIFNDINSALKYIENIFSLDKNYSAAYNLKGLILKRQNRHEEAEYCFTKSKNLDALNNKIYID